MGQWRLALRVANDAERILSEQCSGVAWERATSTQIRFTAIFYLGEWRSLVESASHFRNQIEEAKARGDLHGMVACIPHGTLPFLILDQPVAAAQFIHDTIAAFPSKRYLMPRVWELNLLVYTALYAGDAVGAWRLVASQWPALQASQLLRVEYVAVVAFDFRARAAIAAAATSGNQNRTHYLKEASHCARMLARKHSRWASSMALLIEAGIASVNGQHDTAAVLLERAETEFDAAEMSHYVAACKHRRGQLANGEAGRQLTAAAESWAHAQGIVNSERIFNLLAPGKWDTLPNAQTATASGG
jgi:hypothetical protein